MLNLFRLLDLENIMDLLKSVLLEKKIVLISDKIEVLSEVNLTI